MTYTSYLLEGYAWEAFHRSTKTDGLKSFLWMVVYSFFVFLAFIADLPDFIKTLNWKEAAYLIGLPVAFVVYHEVAYWFGIEASLILLVATFAVFTPFMLYELWKIKRMKHHV